MTPPPDQPVQPDLLSMELARRQYQADCEFNAALARFQAIVQPVADYHLATVVNAARPAFELGFCWLVHQNSETINVHLRHAAGAEETSTAPAASVCSPALMLAGLLGIPLQAPGCSSEPEEHTDGPSGAQPEQIAVIASDALPTQSAEAPDLMGPDSPPELPSTHPSLRLLTPEEIYAALQLIKVMPAPARKSFTIHFRNAFHVPDTVMRIAGEITQLRHLDFIDRFNLEAAGGVSS